MRPLSPDGRPEPGPLRRLLLPVPLLLVLLLAAPAAAQAPAPAGPWQVSLNWRYFVADVHVRGGEVDHRRKAAGTEVANTVHLALVGITYAVDPQTSVAVGVPYLMAERSTPYFRTDGTLAGRSLSQARGLGDVTVSVRRLLADPAGKPRANLTLGVGVKLPTGANNVADRATRLVDGVPVTAIETVDPSIQPGDGGFAALFDLAGTLRWSADATLYAAGSYVLSPEETNGVATFRPRPSEAEVSVTDRYALRLGATWAPARWNGWSAALGGRLEGVPVHDLVGGSDGFRRPGYTLYAEPAIAWKRGAGTFSLAVPVAVERHRSRSVPDRRDGVHGDATLPDFVVLAGYQRRF